MRVCEVNVAEHIDQALGLLAENWAETGFDFELRPDFHGYRRLQELGILFAVAAFDGDQVIGYSTAVITPHLFNPRLNFCHTDALFVTKKYRGTSVGARLIAETERVAKARGAHRIHWHTRSGTTLGEALTNRAAYHAVDTIVEKVL